MNTRSFIIKSLISIIVISGIAELFFLSCGDKIKTPSESNYIVGLHNDFFRSDIKSLTPNNLSLYVDYSTCISLGQHSDFFNSLVPAMVDATTSYFSIEGDKITEHQADSTYNLLKSIEEVYYADLKTAIERMAEGNSEAVLLTDGEYYQNNIAKNNANNPYMAPAFKKWLLKGHDIFIISEPYVEKHKGNEYNKKRFYLVFTDIRIPGNFYNRLRQTVRFEDYPGVEMFHLAADHPTMLAQGDKRFVINENIQSIVSENNGFEIQDWQISWKDGIEPLVIGAVNPKTGESMPHGECVMDGLKIDRNSLGAFRIKGVEAKVYDINEMYVVYTEAKETNQKPDLSMFENILPVEDFLVIGKDEFSRHGCLSLYFVPEKYYPQSCLTGSPFNYTKVDIYVNEIEPIFEQYKEMFEFESIDVPGAKNISVAESIKQCMTDPEVQTKVKQTPIYTIYIKSLKY